MAHTIRSVEPGSLADQLGILPGDRLVTINGQKVVDWIDYQALTCQDVMSVLTERSDEQIVYDFEKDEYEPLGLGFSSQLMSPVRQCANRCVFCFVDQLPPDVRPTLRVKDDDWRLSLMMGNFVTLTNVTDRELQRIIERNASPLYISVHATRPRLREELLGSSRGGRIMEQLTALRDAGLSFHAQAVLCPGLNDGPELDRTIGDLMSLQPAALSLALVPVGLTGHREGLPAIAPYNRGTARQVLRQMEAWQAKSLNRWGTRFVFAADEFYRMAGELVPPDEDYEGYPQIENGVGLIRLFMEEFEQAYGEEDLSRAKKKRALILTGTSFQPVLDQWLSEHPIPGVTATVLGVKNGFFGEEVTTAGLLTGGDILAAARENRGTADRLYITHYMLRDGEDVFLDGMTLDALMRASPLPVTVVGMEGGDLLRALIDQ